jgi:hypothetical protein
MKHRLLALALAATSLACPASVWAQQLRGTVRDSTSGQPISGAVIVLFDSAGAMRGRNITNERGEYRLAVPASVQRVRVLRIGFRARDITLPRAAGDMTQLDIAMAPIPTLLAPVQVQSAASCPRRSDRAAALALLEQARAGLLTTIVAREANPAQLVRLSFDRKMAGVTDRIERQIVRIDSTRRSAGSYQAVRSAAEFVQEGFMHETADGQTYFGPDAEVLLDDRFTAGYCFHIHDPAADRPHEVGLAFVPAGHRYGRVDIDGTLWIDTVARALRDIEFRYLGLDRDVEDLHAGGLVSFREMDNGVVLIDRWVLRLPSPGADTTYSANRTPIIRAKYVAREAGGEVARAAWPDGHAWTASLGRIRIRAVNASGDPVASAIVRLDSTTYAAKTDARGNLEISNLLPGPYAATVITPSSAELGMVFPTALRFVAERDSTIDAPLLVPAEDDFIRKGCTAGGAGDDKNPWLIVRVVGDDGQPVENAHWHMSRDFGIPWQRVTETRRTDARGQVHYCMLLARGDGVLIRAWRDGEAPTPFPIRRIGRPHTEVTVKLPRRP